MLVKHQLQGKIPRRASHCAYRQEPFEPGSDYLSFLILRDDDWIREDYCASCWQEIEERKKGEAGNFWRGKIPEKISKKMTVDAKALQFFRTAIETATNPKLLYVLTLYLERNKQVIKRHEVEEKKGHRYFEILETGEVFSIELFLLSEEEGNLLASELSMILSKNE